MTRRTFSQTPPQGRYQSFLDFAYRGHDARGRIEILERDLPVHLFNEDLGRPTTLVTFNGAVTPAVKELPAWIGWGTTRSLDANRIFTSDPSLALAQDLLLGWYAGSRVHPFLQTQLVEALKQLIGDRTPVFYGQSGGGFAALAAAVHFPGSIVIAINPQTSIEGYYEAHVEKYRDRAWGRAPWPAHVVDTVLPLYAEPQDVSVLYIQNSRDPFHIEHHLTPFRDTVHASNRVHYVKTALGDGHVGPNKASHEALFKAVVAAADSHASFADLAAAVDALPLEAA